MIYIAWALLDIAVLICLAVLLYKAVKAKLGGFSEGFAVFLLLGFCGPSKRKDGEIESSSNRLKTWEFVRKDSLAQKDFRNTNITLEKNIFHSYSLGINWDALKSTGKIVPTTAYSCTTGLSIGTVWNPVMITANETEVAGTYRYEVTGTINWYILGMKIYVQPKNWTGVITYQ